MKLNGWQRIGVVASALWAIGAVYYVRVGDISYGREYRRLLLESCMPEWTTLCQDAAHAKYRSMVAWDLVQTADIAASALIPVLMGWVLAYLIVKIARWVKAGF